VAAYLYITEYYAGNWGGIQAPICPPLVRQSRIDFSGGGSIQSQAFSGDTRMIEVTCDGVCSVIVGGLNPIATVNDSRFYIGRVAYFIVTPGDKLAVIVNV
jgi:hypothetical protein